MRTIIDTSIPVPAYRVGGSGDPDRLDIEYQITDEEWTSAGGCPCGRYHGQRDGAQVHCAWREAHAQFVREMERKHWANKHAQHDASDRELIARLLRGES